MGASLVSIIKRKQPDSPWIQKCRDGYHIYKGADSYFRLYMKFYVDIQQVPHVTKDMPPIY